MSWDDPNSNPMQDIRDVLEADFERGLGPSPRIWLNRTAQFECGCWLHKVGCVRYPAITGTMCCPIHRKPYPKIETHFAMLDFDEE